MDPGQIPLKVAIRLDAWSLGSDGRHELVGPDRRYRQPVGPDTSVDDPWAIADPDGDSFREEPAKRGSHHAASAWHKIIDLVQDGNGSVRISSPLTIGGRAGSPRPRGCGPAGAIGRWRPGHALGELLTVRTHHVPIKVIVFNNPSLGMVQLELVVAGDPPLETDRDGPLSWTWSLRANAFEPRPTSPRPKPGTSPCLSAGRCWPEASQHARTRPRQPPEHPRP